jgi:hypothetical protein
MLMAKRSLAQQEIPPLSSLLELFMDSVQVRSHRFYVGPKYKWDSSLELSSPITYLKLTRATVKGEQVTFKESTRPSGTFKAHFFQDLFQSSASPGFLLAMRVFYDGDTYVSLPGKFWVLDYVVRYSREFSTTVDNLLTDKFISVVGLISKAFAPTKLPKIKRMGEQGATAEQIAASKGFFSK